MSFMDGKNVVEMGDSTKDAQPGSLVEISYWRSILRTNMMVTKNILLLNWNCLTLHCLLQSEHKGS